MEDGGGVVEDEVDVAGDAVGLVELAEGVGVEGVLVVEELHRLEHGEVAVRAEGHNLVLVQPDGVGEGQVSGHEVISTHACGRTNI